MSMIPKYLVTPQTLRIWLQIFIRDVRSSNGTFINGERLSPEGVESDPVEIKNEDQIVSEFHSTQKNSKLSGNPGFWYRYCQRRQPHHRAP